MANFYLDEAISDLESNGLVAREDYLYVEPTSCSVIGQENQEVDAGVNRLGRYIQDHGMMISYVHAGDLKREVVSCRSYLARLFEVRAI